MEVGICILELLTLCLTISTLLHLQISDLNTHSNGGGTMNATRTSSVRILPGICYPMIKLSQV